MVVPTLAATVSERWLRKNESEKKTEKVSSNSIKTGRAIAQTEGSFLNGEAGAGE
jgi:hypothetical protein